jgi:malonyl CoA-acyl carrier protein transacylase
MEVLNMLEQKPVAIVGIGAIMPDAPDARGFWENIKNGLYSIKEVPADRWRQDLYFNADPKATDKTYSKIGAWVTNFEFNPLKLHIPIPPTVLAQMDLTQQWGIYCSHQALSDYGYPERSIDPERIAVILGNANAGERHYRSTMRILLPEYLEALKHSNAFGNLPAELQQQLLDGMRINIQNQIPDITEDTMSGELSNVIAGRIANVFNFSGPNFVTDAACASSLSAIQAAVNGLNNFQFDMVLSGGVDRNMGPESFVKFCKIGALSADGSRPYSEGANGFVMGEGAAIFLLKRLADAERDGDKIYAVIRGIGSSSDGKGKGITAPNPAGQQKAIERAWQNAGVSPASAGLIEGHGTSTRVGDVVEVNSLNTIFGQLGLQPRSIALGSVKSNIGHLKGAAGAAGVAKVAFALDQKVLPPSANFERPNPNIDFDHMPFYVNTSAKPWEKPAADIRRAAISSFGFGGTNFHVVMEEYLPGYHSDAKPAFTMPVQAKAQVADPVPPASSPINSSIPAQGEAVKAYVLSAVSEKTGYPAEMLDMDLDLEADLGIDTVKQAELFAAIRQNYGIPRREDLRLSEYNTLAKVTQFVLDNSQPGAAVVEAKEPAPAVQAAASHNVGEVKEYVLQQVAEKTGYPVDMLDLDLDLEADLGVDTVKQAELFAAVREHYGIPKREDLRLSEYNTLAKVIGFFNENTATQKPASPMATAQTQPEASPTAGSRAEPLSAEHFRGLLFLSANSLPELRAKLEESISQAKAGTLPASKLPDSQALSLPERLAIDYADNDEFLKRSEKALKGFEGNSQAVWQALTAQGVYYGSGAPGKVAFLFPGQGSQYVNMLKEFRAIEPVVDEVFVEADRVMTPLLGKPLTDFIYADGDEDSLKAAEVKLKDTTITQPAVLTANIALLRLLQKYGFEPDAVIGHSLGEYAALVASGVLTFAEALEVVSARGREMVKVAMEDNGCMAAVSAPLTEVERILKTVDGYVVLANINSPLQSVIAGGTKAVEAAIQAFTDANFQAVKIPVSHAFHTKIVAPASIPLRKVIERMNIKDPQIPIAANVTGDWYPNGREAILDLLADQVASPVQFIKGAQKLYDYGVTIFVEVGPKRVLNALTSDIFKDNPTVTLLATNHPRKGALPSFNEALCALYAAGLPLKTETAAKAADSPAAFAFPAAAPVKDGRLPLSGSIVISGAGLGLPGRNNSVFAEDNIQRLLNGEVRIEPFPEQTRLNMVEKRSIRLVKQDSGAVMDPIDSPEKTVKLAGQRGSFDPVLEFGLPEDRAEATDISTQLAIAAGIDALRDAGIPLVMNYRTTSKGTLLPNRWMLPEALQDETGIIFGSAFPGMARMSEEADKYYTFRSLLDQKNQLLDLIAMFNGSDSNIKSALQQKLKELEDRIAANDYQFHRNFVFRILAMGHSQFAEHIGARGPNTYVNAACATTTHAINIAEDWIRAGRCRRVIIVAGDDVTSGELVNWVGTGLMASGAATTEANVRMAAIPFDRRRNGMIMGMGAAALVVEAEDAVRERGMRGICELLSSQIANSAYHGTRLDVPHVSEVMNRVLTQAEERFGIQRSEIAAKTVFVSHETYTPARGGSAAAEIFALRQAFGLQANQVVIANTKGFTGHTMGVGVEDVIAAKALEFGIVPPIAHFDQDFQPDPDLGDLNLSKGGHYPVEYSLRLGAGFGSQIAMTLLRKVAGVGERVDQKRYREWLEAVSGYQQPELEVVQHNLRIKHSGVPKNRPLKSNWQFGQGPQGWASEAPASEPPASGLVKNTPNEMQPELSQAVSTPAQTQEFEAEHSPAAAPAAQGKQDEITAVILTKVSEKTGYPSEMLDLDLDLEADLGIDTVKQAELFASIREHFGIPRKEDLRLADYNTLTKVVQFVIDSLNAQKQPQAETAKAQQQDAAPVNGVPTMDTSAGETPAAQIKRRVPLAILRPRLDLCKPTAITLDQNSRVVIAADKGKNASALQKKLSSLNVETLLLKTEKPEEIQAQVKGWLESGPIQGLYFLPSLNLENALTEMTSADWASGLESKLYALVEAMRSLTGLKFLLAATHFDGLHGLSAQGARNALGGASAGFVKALGREREDLLVKVVDFEEDEKANVLASRLVEETLFDPAVQEVAWEGNQRFTVVLSEEALSPDTPNPLSTGTVFLVSGGSGGITSPILVDLAKATQGHFYLLARSPLPAANDPRLKLLREDVEKLKFSLLQQLSKDGKKATPAIINQEIAGLERAAAALNTIQTIEQSGGKALYLQCDVSDADSIRAAIHSVLEKEDRIDVLIHAAGMEKSRKLENKSDAEFRQIVDIKAGGLFRIFKTLEELQKLPKAIVNFGSIAGRFGNSGQTDYSAANDLLTRLSSAIRGQHPQIQVVTLDWGAWAEVGMASRGYIPDLMKRAGIDMVNPQEAAPYVRRELEAGSSGEVILAGSMGQLETQTDPDGGIDVAKTNGALTSGNPIHVMLSRASGFSLKEGILLEAELDPSQEPFLKDHALNGTPLLPGVMGIEGFAVAAEHVASSLGSAKGGFRVESLSEIEFLTAFKFYKDEPRRITWKAQVVREAEGLVARVSLESKFARRQGKVDLTVHFKGKVHLVPESQPRKTEKSQPPHWNGAYTIPAEDIYKLYFHGPSFQVLAGVQKDGDVVLGKLNKEIPPLTENKGLMVSVPVLVELCFQTAGIWEIGMDGALSLPKSIGSLRLFENKVNGVPIFAQVRQQTTAEGGRSFNARVIDSQGLVYLEMGDYKTVSLPYGVEKDLLSPINKLMKPN